MAGKIHAKNFYFWWTTMIFPGLRLVLIWFFLSTLITLRVGSAAADPARYVTIGPEAYAILRQLVGEDRVAAVQPGELSAQIANNANGYIALVMPEDWGDETDLNAAQAAGLQVVRVRRHNSIANVLANIRALGVLTGQAAQADAWASALSTRLVSIRRQYAALVPVRVLVLTPEAYTPGKGALITELIGLVSGVNVAAEAGIPEARQIEDAQIRSLAPDVVLLLNWSPSAASRFVQNPVYQDLPAFQAGHVHRVDSPGKDPARLLEDVAALADWLHPAWF